MKVIVEDMTADREITVYDNVFRVTTTTHYCSLLYFDKDAQIQGKKLNLLLVNVKII